MTRNNARDVAKEAYHFFLTTGRTFHRIGINTATVQDKTVVVENSNQMFVFDVKESWS